MIDKLKNWGCNVDEALERFVDDKELYITCFNMFLVDPSFVSLEQALNAQDVKAAFEACHTLKGVAGNLSAGPLYQSICDLTEKLRAGSMENTQQDLEKILQLKDYALKLLS